MYINAKGVELKTTSTGNGAVTNAGGGVWVGTSKADLMNSVRGGTLKGGLGDDVYYLWDSTSKIVENANAGNDTVYVKYWGTLQLAANVENAVAASPGVNGLTGNALDNLLIAGEMRATLDGGAGSDILVGGDGADIFKIKAGNGSDVIYDFKPGWDIVKLTGYSFTTFAQLKAAATQKGDDVVVKLSGSETLTLRDVLLKDLAAEDFGLAMPKAAVVSGSSLLTGVNQAVNAKGWYVHTNAWGAPGLKAGKDYIVTGSYRKADMTEGTTFNWSFPLSTDMYPTIKAYPEVIFGISPLNGVRKNPTDTKMVFPVKVSDLVGLTASYDVSYAGNTGGFNVAYDIWLTNKAYGDKSTITNEIMVWVHKGDFEPMGAQVGTYTKGSFTAKIYHNNKYTAIVADKDIPKGTIDIADIIAKLKSMGYVSNSEYVASVELGSEVVSGQGSLTINDLDLVVSSRSSTGVITTKTVGGNGTTVKTSSSSGGDPAPDSGSGPKPEAPKPDSPKPDTPTETPSTGAAPKDFYKAGTKTMVDDHGVTLGKAVTTVSGSTATVTFTDTVGKSLGRDVVALSTTTATVQHYDGAGKLIGSDKQTFAADGVITTHRYDADGAAIETLKAFEDSNGAQVTQHFNSSLKLVSVDKVTTASGIKTIQHYDGANAFLGHETVSKATDGTITIRYSDQNRQLTAVDTIKVDDGVTVVNHFDAKAKFLGFDVSTIDSTGVTKTVAYTGGSKVESTTYIGSDRADTLKGSSGVTHFHGGLGSDKMTGGSGVDYFHFDSALTQGDVDLISSFNAAKDRVVLDHTIFTEVGAVGALRSAVFVAGTKALDSADRIIFDKATGQLWYDEDGSGSHAPVLLAKITADAGLTAGNFTVS